MKPPMTNDIRYRDEFAWACACTDGSPHPFIHENSVRTNRRDAQACLGEAWRHEGETVEQGWKRAYRRGWRCIRVLISPAFAEKPHDE